MITRADGIRYYEDGDKDVSTDHVLYCCNKNIEILTRYIDQMRKELDELREKVENGK